MRVTYRDATRGLNGRSDVLWVPRLNRGLDRRPIIYCHGSANTPEQVHAQGGQAKLIQRLVSYGFPVFVGRMGANLQNWGNAEFKDEVDDVLDYLDNHPYGWRTDKVHLVGCSQGATGICNWAGSTPERAERVASITGLIPHVGPQEARVANAGLRAAVDTAWGVAWPAALPAGAQPIENAAAVAGTPTHMFIAEGDAVADFRTPAIAYANAVGGQYTLVPGIAHSDAGIGGIPVAPLVGHLFSSDD